MHALIFTIMEIKINDKIFTGEYIKNGVRIKLEEDDDKIFFKKWSEKSNTPILKKEYVVDVDFTELTQRGILRNCYPVPYLNINVVELIYDYKEVFSSIYSDNKMCELGMDYEKCPEHRLNELGCSTCEKYKYIKLLL